MVSHVPFLDLNTVKKDKRMTISQFILSVLLFFMRFRLPVQNAFKDSCQHSTTEPGQKQRLPFYDISLVVKKKSFFKPPRNNASVGGKVPELFIPTVLLQPPSIFHSLAPNLKRGNVE